MIKNPEISWCQDSPYPQFFSHHNAQLKDHSIGFPATHTAWLLRAIRFMRGILSRHSEIRCHFPTTPLAFNRAGLDQCDSQ
ncbi:MAG: hypothetical protein EBU26_10050, partial [Verrucomicrobia bacterium]|nr:hypothetical protein [Verrucomicrobiota bacterium]